MIIVDILKRNEIKVTITRKNILGIMSSPDFAASVEQI
jgi:hypothetical protein